MALNKVFIPLSMLTTSSLNRIEHNDVKYKWLNYGSGTGKTFLDDTSFPAKDELNDFKFGQAYTNWLTLIETVSDPVVESGWHTHHKCMTSDREFLDWAPAWHTHDQMLCTHFMLKPFILDPCSTLYEKQFERCKLNQALLGALGSSRDYMLSQSRPTDSTKGSSDTH